MQNALVTPPAPEGLERPQLAGLQANALASSPTSAPPASGGGQPTQPQAQLPQQAPAPTHGMTVAALRHFAAVSKVIGSILRDPGLGKSNVKGKIIEGVSQLVAQRVMSPATAVEQLQTVPTEPFKQKEWLQQHMQTLITAQNAVLDNHRAAFTGVPDDQMDMRVGHPDDHMDDMKMLMGHYKR